MSKRNKSINIFSSKYNRKLRLIQEKKEEAIKDYFKNALFDTIKDIDMLEKTVDIIYNELDNHCYPEDLFHEEISEYLINYKRR